jgi:hypothetical protein
MAAALQLNDSQEAAIKRLVFEYRVGVILAEIFEKDPKASDFRGLLKAIRKVDPSVLRARFEQISMYSLSPMSGKVF